jgi:lysophospholipase L1-like esterase
MNNRVLIRGESADLFDAASGRFYGVVDRHGREVLVTASDPVSGVLQSVAPAAHQVPNALGRFRRALQATLAGTADTRLAVLGDSTIAGAYGAGVIWAGGRALSPPAYLASKLSALVPVSEDSSFGNGGSGGFVFDPRVTTTTANWTVFTPNWLGGSCYRNDTNEASTLSFAFAQAFDTIDVYYLQSTGGASFTIGVDGGAALGATVSTNGGLSVIKVTRSCPAGSRTVNINRLAGAGACPIYAVVTSNTARRAVQVYNWGVGGAKAGDWVDNTNSYNQFGGIATLAPHLTIINVGINDAIAGTTSGTFTTQMQTLIDQCQLSGDVVLTIPTPIGVSNATKAVQDGLYRALRNLAATNGCPVVDAYSLYGTQVAGAAAGFFQQAVDTIHPTAAGYEAVADLMIETLGLKGR